MNIKTLTTAKSLHHPLLNGYSLLVCMALYCYPYDVSLLSTTTLICLALNALRTQKIYCYHLYQSQLRSTQLFLACIVQFALLWTPICLATISASYLRLDCLSCSCFGLLLGNIIHDQLANYVKTPHLNHAYHSYIQSTCGMVCGAIAYKTIATQSPLGMLLTACIWYLCHKSTQDHPKEPITKPASKSYTYTHIMWLGLQISWLVNTISAPYLSIGLLLGIHSFIASQRSPTSHSRVCWLYLNNALVLGLLTSCNLTEPTSYLSTCLLTILLIRLGTICAELTIDTYQHLPNTTHTQFIYHSLSLVTIGGGIYLQQTIDLPYSTLIMLTLALCVSYLHQRAANLEPLFLIASHLLKDIFRTLFGVRIHGQHPQPTTEPTLVIANHTCLLDVPLIAALFPEKLVYPIFPTWMQFWAIRTMGAVFADIFPMKPTSPHSMLQVVKTIKTGKRCLIFPEGRLSNTGNLMKLYDGAAFICEHTKARLQTIIITGGMNHISSRNDHRSVKRLLPKIHMGISASREIDCGELSAKEKKPFIIRQMYQELTNTQLQMQPKNSIYELISQAKKAYHHQQHILRDHNWVDVYTYDTLLKEALRISKGLAHLPHNSIIALPMPSESVLAIHTLGCFFAGHCALPIDPTLSTAQQLTLMKRYRIALCVYNEPNDTLTTSLNEHNIPHKCAQDIAKTTYFWDYPNHNTKDLPAIIFADPEGNEVILSQYNIISHAQQLSIHCNTFGYDCVYNQLGLHTPMGFHMGLMLPIVCGIPTTLTGGDKQPNAEIESIYDTQSSIIIAKRTLFENAKEHINNYQDTNRIRTIYYPGPMIAAELVNHWIHHCKAHLFSVHCPDDIGCVLAMHQPTYHQDTGLGQLLSGMHYGDNLEYCHGPIASGAVFSKVSGPQISNHYYDDTQQQIRSHDNTHYTFEAPLYMNPTGFISEQEA